MSTHYVTVGLPIEEYDCALYVSGWIVYFMDPNDECKREWTEYFAEGYFQTEQDIRESYPDFVVLQIQTFRMRVGDLD